MKIFLSLLLLAGAVHAQPKLNPLRGVWRVVEYINNGPDGTIYPAQPGIYIFTEKYFSVLHVTADQPRPEVEDLSKATNAELLAIFRPFAAQSGTYEISGTTATMRPTVAKNPIHMRGDYKWTFTFRRDGDTLLITETRYPTIRMRLSRLE